MQASPWPKHTEMNMFTCCQNVEVNARQIYQKGRLLAKAVGFFLCVWHIQIGAKVPGFMHIQLVTLKRKRSTLKAVPAYHLPCKIAPIKIVCVTDFVSISNKSPLDVIQALLGWSHFPSGEVVLPTLVDQDFLMSQCLNNVDDTKKTRCIWLLWPLKQHVDSWLKFEAFRYVPNTILRSLDLPL